MTLHVTIPIEPDELERFRRRAADVGIPLEQFLHGLLQRALPPEPPMPTGRIEDLFNLVPADAGESTDIGRDKDKLVGEAVWKEHLRKTRQSQ